MKFTTFEKSLLAAQNLYDRACNQDKKLQEALGGDSQIMTEWWDESISDILSILGTELGNQEAIDWLFWDSMNSISGYSDFEYNDSIYVGNPQNIWLELNGQLDERYSKNVQKDNFDSHDYERMGEPQDEEDVQKDIVDKPWDTRNFVSTLPCNIEMSNTTDYADDTNTVDSKINKSFVYEIKEDYIPKPTQDEHREAKENILTDYQINIESVELASILKTKMSDYIEDEEISSGKFNTLIKMEFDRIKAKGRNKEIQDKIINQINISASNVLFEEVDDNSLDNLRNEIVLFLNTQKNSCFINDYIVKIPNEDIPTINIAIRYKKDEPFTDIICTITGTTVDMKVE